MKKKLYLFLLIGVCFSCNTAQELEKEGITFIYTDSVSKELADSISDYFARCKRKKDMNWVGLDKVKSVKIDSAYYSYLLYLNLSNLDSVLTDKQKKVSYQAFAKFLSVDRFDSARVHIFLTDDNFEVKEGLPYDPKSYTVIESNYTYHNAETKILVKGEFIDMVAKGLYHEFRLNKPELFKSTDSLYIELSKKDVEVGVNIFIDPKQINLATLVNQFEKSDPLIYDILFSYYPTYFNIIDKDTQEKLKVIAHRISEE
ncbi:hypothetical protein [Pontibacter mucosus]|nr:hypothetical protein [Pontibacter mucosus]